jgi:hypothetical protein
METKIENFTSRMAALMGRLRREMNGAVVESMQRAGVRGMLNYGVSIPTLRAIAREQGSDHAFARFLFKQQVRELRLAAASIAEPSRVTPSEAEEWVAGAGSLEIVDEVAMCLLSRASGEVHRAMTDSWLKGENSLNCYASLMSLNRTSIPAEELFPAIYDLLKRFPEDRNVARAALAYSTFHYGAYALEKFPDTPSGRFVREELHALFA